MHCKVRRKNKSTPASKMALINRSKRRYSSNNSIWRSSFGLNVVIHQRDAWEDTLEIMQPYTDKVRGVFHCFGGTLEQANEVIDLDHLVSFTGIVTFKNGASVRAGRGTNSALEIHGGNRLSLSRAGALSRVNGANLLIPVSWPNRSRVHEGFGWRNWRKPRPKPRKSFFGLIDER